MKEPTEQYLILQRRHRILMGISGVLLGALVGVGAIAFSKREAPSQVDNASAMPTRGQVTERWFIWEGAAPIVGDPFKAEADCEVARRAFVERELEIAERALKNLRPMTLREIQMIGNPADQIMARVTQVRRAYCHQPQ